MLSQGAASQIARRTASIIHRTGQSTSIYDTPLSKRDRPCEPSNFGEHLEGFAYIE